MPSVYRKLLALLDARDRRRAALMFVLMLTIALSEVVGVASVMPFIAVLSNPEVISENPWLARTYAMFGFADRNQFLLALGGAFLVMLLGSQALKALGMWAQLRFSFNRSVTWSSRLIAAYLRQPYEWFLNRHSADLATSILSEVDTVITGALVPVMQVLAQALVAVLLLALLLVVDPLLALSVGIVLGGGFAAVSVFFRTRMRRISRERYEANRARYHVVQEAFGGIKDIKLAGLEEVALRRFRHPSNVRARHQIAAGLIGQLPSVAMQSLLFGGMLLVLMYLIGVHGSFQEALPIVGLYALAGYRLMPAIQKVFEEITKLRSSEAAIESLANDLGTLERRGAEAARAVRTDIDRVPLRDAITLQAVRYGYPNTERPALDGLSLSIPANHSIGLVGSTGSGKTTLVDVVLGLLSPSSGEMHVDGTRIDPTTVRAWQRSLGYVPQHIFLADDTIAANIAFGLPKREIDLAQVERAARIANLHDFIATDLPDGYETRVGERGVRLSGGQRQRIGIARALYHDPDVLILDEATSALDNLTEHAVMDAVRSLARRKTLIMIAHRLSTVRECDRIYMLEHGQVVASGSYEELLATNERFRLLAATA
jgi:ATP-binding cassette, subfamily B, bacterial PglK